MAEAHYHTNNQDCVSEKLHRKKDVGPKHVNHHVHPA
jgi:hypothetical protein